MRNQLVKTIEPKDRRAALNLAGYILDQLDNCSKRKENVMINKSNAENKIKKLQDTLNSYQSQIESIDKTQRNWTEKLDDLKLKFELTESEILEIRSALLRKQISALELKANIQETGKHKDF